MNVARGLVLVTPVETEQTLAGGQIILVDQTREALAQYQCEVVAVGAPAICEDDDCPRPHGTSGDDLIHIIPDMLILGAWALVKPRSYVPSDDPLGKTYYVKQDDVLAVFRVAE